MTDETKAEVLTKAAGGSALLSGRSARLTVWIFALICAAAPMLTYIPPFTGWRDIVGWWVLFLAALASPILTGLVPREDQEAFRQALVESEAQRRALHEELKTYRSSGGFVPPRPGDPQP